MAIDKKGILKRVGSWYKRGAKSAAARKKRERASAGGRGRMSPADRHRAMRERRARKTTVAADPVSKKANRFVPGRIFKEKEVGAARDDLVRSLDAGPTGEVKTKWENLPEKSLAGPSPDKATEEQEALMLVARQKKWGKQALKKLKDLFK